MTTERVERVVEEIKTLTKEEQRQLRGMLDDPMDNPLDNPRDAALLRELAEIVAGVLARALREMLNYRPTESRPQITEEEFERRLAEKGIIGRVPPPITDLTPYQDRKPMRVQGEPLSETIIEERR